MYFANFAKTLYKIQHAVKSVNLHFALHVLINSRLTMDINALMAVEMEFEDVLSQENTKRHLKHSISLVSLKTKDASRKSIIRS